MPIIRPVVQRLSSSTTGYGPLDAVYDQSQGAKQGGYNAFFNINFDQFSTKTLSTPVTGKSQVQVAKSNYTAFTNEVLMAAPQGPTISSTGQKKASGEF